MISYNTIYIYNSKTEKNQIKLIENEIKIDISIVKKIRICDIIYKKR